MKTTEKKSLRTLSLNKAMIVNLNSNEKIKIVGGGPGCDAQTGIPCIARR